eukprot:15327456-Ditylum_brightwellii.AAC.1
MRKHFPMSPSVDHIIVSLYILAIIVNYPGKEVERGYNTPPMDKAVHEHILNPVLRDCLPAIGACADTVSAVTSCMVPRYKMYRLHKDYES